MTEAQFLLEERLGIQRDNDDRVVLVCGGRDFTDAAMVKRVMDELAESHGPFVVRHGVARGADTLAGKWAQKRGFRVDAMPADWDKHGRRAGYVRNAAMLAKGGVILVVAFPGGRGTADMCRQAERAGVSVRRAKAERQKPSRRVGHEVAPKLPGLG